MKKIIVIIALLAAGFGLWKYVSFRVEQSSAIKAAKETVDQSVNYVPSAIERKNKMENSINDSVAKENERLQKSMDAIK